MTDPLEPLRHPDPDVVSLPADQVRRRGDRIRARRSALGVLAAAAVVAVVASGGALVTRHGDQAPTNQAASSSPTLPPVVARIPAGIPITAGWPAEDDQTKISTHAKPLDALTWCGRTGYPTTAPVEHRTALYQGPEDFRSREVTTHPSTAVAQKVLADIRDAVAACPSEKDGSVPVLNSIRPLPSGDEAFVVLSAPRKPSLPGIETLVVVRIGKAVVLSTRYDEGAADQAPGRAQDDAHQLAPLLEALSSR